APFELKSKRQRLRAGWTFSLESGEVLEIGGTYEGMRAYLCVAGGFQENIILGSRSGLEPVQQDALLRCLPGRIGRHFALMKLGWDIVVQRLFPPIAVPLQGAIPKRQHVHLLRFLPGPQGNWFPRDLGLAGTKSGSLPPPYKVHPDSNRMGLRLQGPPIPYPN